MPRRTKSDILLAAAVLVIAAAAGCRSVYHDAREALPTDPRERVDLRLREAGSAAEQAARHAQALAHSRALGGTEAELAVGRLEAAAWELDRRLLSLHDALAVAPTQRERRAAAIEALEAGSLSLSRAIERLRGAGTGPAAADVARAAADLRESVAAVRAEVPHRGR